MQQDVQSTGDVDRHPVFVGYDIEMALARHFALAAGQHPQFAFVFGFPGVGKTQFARALLRDLREKGQEYLVRAIACDDIAVMHPENAIQTLHDVTTLIFTSPPEIRQMLVLDEIDLLARQGPSRSVVSSWAINLYRRIRDKAFPVFVLAATNYPSETDPCIQGEINVGIYVAPPTDSVLGAIAAERLRLDPAAAAELVASYRQITDEMLRIPMTRQFRAAMDHLVELEPEWRDHLSMHAVAQTLAEIVRQPTADEFNHWQHREQAWIEASERLKDFFRRTGQSRKTHD